MHCAHLIAHTYIGFHFHSAWLVPAPAPAPAPLLHIAVDTLLGLTLKAVYSDTVKGPLGIQMVGGGNDSGWFVPHLCIPPNNALVVLHIALGGSKPMFNASTVEIMTNQGAKPTAAVCFPMNFVSLNQACSDPCNLPLDAVISPNSVLVGLTWGDVLAGLINMAVDSAISGICNAGMGSVTSALGSRMAALVGRETVEALASRVGAALGPGFVRAASNQLTQTLVRDGIEGYLGNLAGDLASAGTEALTDPMREAMNEEGRRQDPPGTQGSTPVHRAQ